jgi:uncharacterized heparinase superfamily protein
VFADFGLAILRANNTIVTLSNGPVGTSGFGNHKHCDQLAVEIVIGEQPVFVDGGTYLYTADPSARNHFRSTASHNTVMIDGVEQHEFKPEWLFRMFQTGTATLAVLDVDGGHDLGVEGTHTGYSRLTPPVVHRRQVRLSEAGAVIIDDAFDSASGHDYRWHFLLHPDVVPQMVADHVALSWTGGSARLVMPERLKPRIEDAWYSPAYGVRVPTKSISASTADATGGVRVIVEPSR